MPVPGTAVVRPSSPVMARSAATATWVRTVARSLSGLGSAAPEVAVSTLSSTVPAARVGSACSTAATATAEPGGSSPRSQGKKGGWLHGGLTLSRRVPAGAGLWSTTWAVPGPRLCTARVVP